MTYHHDLCLAASAVPDVVAVPEVRGHPVEVLLPVRERPVLLRQERPVTLRSVDAIPPDGPGFVGP